MTRKRGPLVLRSITPIVVLALLGSAFAAHGIAEERLPHREGGGPGGWRGHEIEHWRHGDIGHFHEYDLDRWRGGHWFHGDHLGRLGWWWIVDGTWFFYPAAVYPYPDPYVPPTVVTQAPPPPSSPQYWYYCPSAREYYPYVTDCPEAWTPVVPQPTPAR
jgi:hypothetical protein